jgi:AcrR family transcriptional regulator
VTFRRARSDEQRDERRRAILETLAAMLAEMPVSEVSLNELARRVGLAKSNVLRYVESREAALLDLMHARVTGWLAELDAAPTTSGTERERTDALAALLATSLAARPVLCDLLGAQSAVLERNVSAELAGRHKHVLLDATSELAAIARRHVPELTGDTSFHLAGATMLCAGSVWTACQPNEAMAAAYAADPSLAAMALDLTSTLTRLLAVLTTGLVARA